MMNEMKKMMESMEQMQQMMQQFQQMQQMMSMMSMMFGGVSNPTTATATVPQKKQAQTEFKKDVTVNYIVEKTTSVDGKTFYRIRLENFKDNKKCPYLTKYQKMLINSKITGLESRIQFQFSSEDGKKFNGYGYTKKAEAEKMKATLPTTFTAQEMTEYAKKMQEAGK